MSVSKIKLDGADIYYTPLLEGATRRASELAAEDSLLAAAGFTAGIEHSESGAPYLPAHPELHVSVSHSRRIAALAIAKRQVGIDVEEMRANLPRVLPRVLSAGELNNWGDNPLHAWTAKEALYKAALTPGLDFRRQINIKSLDGATTRATILARRYIVHYEWLGDTLMAVAMVQ